jgi:hypothetical protein
MLNLSCSSWPLPLFHSDYVDSGRSPSASAPKQSALLSSVIMLIATGAPFASVREVEFMLAHAFFLSEDPVIQHHALDKMRTVWRLTARVAMVDFTTEDMAARVYAAFGFASGGELAAAPGEGVHVPSGGCRALIPKGAADAKRRWGRGRKGAS